MFNILVRMLAFSTFVLSLVVCIVKLTIALVASALFLGVEAVAVGAYESAVVEQPEPKFFDIKPLIAAFEAAKAGPKPQVNRPIYTVNEPAWRNRFRGDWQPTPTFDGRYVREPRLQAVNVFKTASAPKILTAAPQVIEEPVAAAPEPLRVVASRRPAVVAPAAPRSLYPHNQRGSSGRTYGLASYSDASSETGSDSSSSVCSDFEFQHEATTPLQESFDNSGFLRSDSPASQPLEFFNAPVHELTIAARAGAPALEPEAVSSAPAQVDQTVLSPPVIIDPEVPTSAPASAPEPAPAPFAAATISSLPAVQVQPFFQWPAPILATLPAMVPAAPVQSSMLNHVSTQLLNQSVGSPPAITSPSPTIPHLSPLFSAIGQGVQSTPVAWQPVLFQPGASDEMEGVSRLKTASQSSDAPIKMVGVEWTPPRPSPIVFTKSIPPAGDDMEGVEYAPPTTISHLIPSQSGGDNMEGIEYASAPAPVPVIPIMPFAPVATQAAATAAQPAAPTQPQPVALPTRIFDLKDFDITRIFNSDRAFFKSKKVHSELSLLYKTNAESLEPFRRFPAPAPFDANERFDWANFDILGFVESNINYFPKRSRDAIRKRIESMIWPTLRAELEPFRLAVPRAAFEKPTRPTTSPAVAATVVVPQVATTPTPPTAKVAVAQTPQAPAIAPLAVTDNVFNMKAFRLAYDTTAIRRRYSDEFAGKTGKDAEDVFKQGWDFDRGAYQDFRRIQQPACVPGFEDFDLAKFDVKGIMKARPDFFVDPSCDEKRTRALRALWMCDWQVFEDHRLVAPRTAASKSQASTTVSHLASTSAVTPLQGGSSAPAASPSAIAAATYLTLSRARFPIALPTLP